MFFNRSVSTHLLQKFMIFKVFHDPSTPISFLWAFKTAVIFIQAMLTNNDEIDEWLNTFVQPSPVYSSYKFVPF
jgi:hypothetical protein